MEPLRVTSLFFLAKTTLSVRLFDQYLAYKTLFA
jgi:hypothetical protein